MEVIGAVRVPGQRGPAQRRRMLEVRDEEGGLGKRQKWGKSRAD